MSKSSVLVVMCLTLSLAGLSSAQEAAAENPPPTIAQQRQETLQWLESFVGDEILLKPDDLSALIEKVSALSDDEFTQWLKETRRLRAILQSPEWEETRAWLREFLAVQAIYSEEELNEFKVDIARMSPAEVIKVLERIRRKHQSLIWMRQASERNRQASLSLRDGLIQQRRSAPGASSSGAARFGPSTRTTGPPRSSYSQRRNSYRNNINIWAGGAGWYRW